MVGLDWIYFTFFTVAVGVLPILAFYYGQHHGRMIMKTKKIPTVEAKAVKEATQAENDAEKLKANDHVRKNGAEGRVENSRVITNSIPGTTLNGNERSLFAPVGLTKERQEDLSFYKAIIGKKATSKSLEALFKKKGFSQEANFIADLGKLRYDYAIQTRQILKLYFSEDSKKKLQNSRYDMICPRAVECAKLNGNLNSTIKKFSPKTVFDPVEQDTILMIGDSLFPNYKLEIEKFVLSMNYVIKHNTLEKLQRLLYAELWELDPELVASFHSKPVHATQYFKSGVLGYTMKKLKGIHSIKHHIFSIERMEEKTGQLGTFILKTQAEPIVLQDAHVLKSDKEPDQFIVKGKSYNNRKNVLQYTFIADGPSERDEWVHCLTRFRRCRENAQLNMAYIINFILAYVRAVENKDWQGVEIVAEEVARHVIESSGGQMRMAVPICMRAALFKAAGSEHWNDEAFKTCCSWFQLMVSTAIDDLRELARKELAGDVGSSPKTPKKNSCNVM